MLLTVALCTWNRAKSLSTALSSFTKLAVPAHVDWEVVVVDNNAKDETPRVVREYSSLLPVRYVFEPQQGLSLARNRAVREALGDLIIFTDDDVSVDPRWLAEYASAAEQFPGAAFFGGTIELRFEAKPPRWLPNNLARLRTAYAYRCVDPGILLINRRQDLPYGANMAFRRSALAGAWFSPRLGRIGEELMSGEETELMAHLIDRGDTGVWVGPARVDHVIPKERLTKSYIHGYFYCQGRGQVRISSFNTEGMSEKRMHKKLRRAQRTARFALSRGEEWARAFVESAVWQGRLAELAAQDRLGAA